MLSACVGVPSNQPPLAGLLEHIGYCALHVMGVWLDRKAMFMILINGTTALHGLWQDVLAAVWGYCAGMWRRTSAIADPAGVILDPALVHIRVALCRASCSRNSMSVRIMWSATCDLT
jgi:hypothetical protein